MPGVQTAGTFARTANYVKTLHSKQSLRAQRHKSSCNYVVNRDGTIKLCLDVCWNRVGGLILHKWPLVGPLTSFAVLHYVTTCGSDWLLVMFVLIRWTGPQDRIWCINDGDGLITGYLNRCGHVTFASLSLSLKVYIKKKNTTTECCTEWFSTEPEEYNDYIIYIFF